MVNAFLLWAIVSQPFSIWPVAIFAFMGLVSIIALSAVGVVEVWMVFLFSVSKSRAIVKEVVPAIATAMYKVWKL